MSDVVLSECICAYIYTDRLGRVHVFVYVCVPCTLFLDCTTDSVYLQEVTD